MQSENKQQQQNKEGPQASSQVSLVRCDRPPQYLCLRLLVPPLSQDCLLFWFLVEQMNNIC